jgi:hypothetical protein
LFLGRANPPFLSQDLWVIPIRRRDPMQFRTGFCEISQFAPAGGGIQVMTVGRRQFVHCSAFIRFLIWQKAGDNAKQSGVKE